MYKTKLNENGEIDKHKARLVAKGYSQKHGVDYTKVFAPVARMDTVRLIIALAAQKNGEIYKHRGLYGLKQAPRAWFSRIEEHFIAEGFQRCDS